MANKNTQITLRVAAVDATARVFKSVASSAMSVTTNIAKWGSVATGAAIGAFALAAKSLGTLSDTAMRAGASAKDLTQLSTALNVIGIKGASVDELATAFQRMTKETGETGTAGFEKVIGKLSQLSTEQERAAAAQKVFGRTGLNFLPLIDMAAKNGTESIKGIAAAMPGVSDAAAQAGDKVADSFTVMGNGVKSIWYEVVGKISSWIDSKFSGGVREAAMKAVAYMRYFAKVSWAYIKPFFTDFWGAFKSLASLLWKWAKNVATMIAGALVTAVENGWERLNGFFYKAAAGVDYVWQKYVNHDDAAADRALALANKESKRVEEFTKHNWQSYRDAIQRLEFKATEGVFANIDTSAADEALKKELANAEEAAKLIEGMNGAAASGFGEFGERAQQAQKTNPEAMLGNSYKAITYAMRAGYATVSDKIIGGIKRAGDFLQKIERNTSEMADGYDFETVG